MKQIVTKVESCKECPYFCDHYNEPNSILELEEKCIIHPECELKDYEELVPKQAVTTMLDKMAQVQVPGGNYTETITKNKYHVTTLWSAKENIEAMPAAGEGE
jgi:hypothetical protein